MNKQSPTLIERINELEKENKQLKAATNQRFENILTRLTECESRISGIESRQSLAETKIKQIIDEITPILTSHAEALKKILANIQK